MAPHVRRTMNTAGKATLSFGMVQLPVKLGKAEADNGVDTTNLCSCGGSLGPMSDDEGNKVACKECGKGFSWYNAADAKGYELGDTTIELEAEAVEAAREDVPVETGTIQKVCPTKDVLVEYAVTGNYYVVPEAEFGAQYAAVARVLNEEDLALLTYLPVGKVRRYAVIAEGGVLMALRLADKRPLDEPVNFEADDSMVEAARGMLDSQRADDPALEDVEDAGLQELIREEAGAARPGAEDAEPAEAPAEDDEDAEPEPEPEPPAATDGGATGLARFE